MIDRIKDSHIIFTWGLTVAVAWLLTAVMAEMKFGVGPIMAMWTTLMLPPVMLTGILKYRNDSNKLFNMWALLIIVLMIENFLTPASLALYSYFHLWIIAGGIAFYYTSKRLPPPSKKTYRYASYASLFVMPLVIYRPLLTSYAAILVQGGPLLYDWYTVHR